MHALSANLMEITGNELDGAGWNRIDCANYSDMKLRSIAWMGAGLFLAGVAGAAVVCRRKGERDLPPEPGETTEHAELRRIMELSAAYNESLYEMLQRLEACAAPAERAGVVADITQNNQVARQEINELRESLQSRLAEHGRTFADVDGFAELISQYRGITLEQQKRHLALYDRVKLMPGVPASPELHAYLRLGFKEEEQRHADTERQLMKAAAEQRELMLRAGRVMSAVANAETAADAAVELNSLGDSYMKISAQIKLYRDDDPSGAVSSVAELRSLYAALLPMLQAQASRLRDAFFFDNDALEEVVERMLPAPSAS